MLKQSLHQKLAQKLSPQQIKLMKLIQLPTIELEQKVKEELEENPAIEEVTDHVAPEDDSFDGDQHIDAKEINVDEYLSDDETPRYRLVANNNSADQEDKSIPISMGGSSLEILEKQLSLRDLDEHRYQIGSFLIGCVNDDGYIRRDLLSIVDDLAFTQNITTDEKEVEEVLKVIQDFEPFGVGARNLQECMQIQLHKKTNSESISLAREIVSTHFNALSKKHYDKLRDGFSASEELLKSALKEISKGNLSESIKGFIASIKS